MTTEKNDHEFIGKLETSFNKLNSKLAELLEENQGLKQQNKILQEGNQEQGKQLEILQQHVLNVEKQKLEENQRLKQQYKTLQEKNQEKDKQLEKLQNHVLNLEKQKLEENQRFKQQYKTLQEKNQEKDKRLEKLQQHVLNLEKQKNEIQQLEKISKNLEKTLEILELDDIHEDDIKILKESSTSLIDKNSEYDKANIPLGIKNSSEPSLEPFNKNLGKVTEKTGPSIKNNINVVVGIDFGVTYSGFAYCHINDMKNICSNDLWNREVGQLKTNTVLQYDDEYNNVKLWGAPALAKNPTRRKKQNNPVELFKLYLGNSQENLRPKLPVDYKKAITDYLRKFGQLIKETVSTRWANLDFFENVLLVLPVPADYSEKDKVILRECVYNAGLLEEKYSQNLQFTTESEAVAIYCMENSLEGPNLLIAGTSFMIVDCGSDTVDLVTRKLIKEKMLQFGEVTVRTGDFCGSTFIDREFAKFLRGKLGNDAIDKLIENHYGQYQYMIQEFTRHVKMPFTGHDTEFCYELYIDEIAPVLLQYVGNKTREIMEDNDWLIDITYNDIKKMFDPIVDRIISIIHIQLSNTRETCSVIFLVGEFSENIYLQKRIKQEFQHSVKTISVPNQPMAAIAHGATLYGLSIRSYLNKLDKLKCVISSRVLKYTYGIQLRSDWKRGDPLNRKKSDGKIDKFSPLARRGTEVTVDQTCSFIFKPEENQTHEKFAFYCTRESFATYINEPGMELLGELTVDLPDVYLGKNRSINIGLTFGEMEITAFAKNELNGQKIMCTFDHGDF